MDDHTRSEGAAGEPVNDRLTWGIILGGGAGAAAWIMFDAWWMAGAGMLAGIALASWFGVTDDR